MVSPLRRLAFNAQQGFVSSNFSSIQNGRRFFSQVPDVKSLSKKFAEKYSHFTSSENSSLRLAVSSLSSRIQHLEGGRLKRILGEDWKFSKEHRMLGVAAALASSYYLVKPRSLLDSLSCKLEKAIKKGDEQSINSLVSEIESAPLIGSDKAKIFQKGLQKAVATDKPDRISTMISHIANATSISDWDRAVIVREGLIRAIELNNSCAVALMISEVSKSPNMNPISLMQTFTGALKMAVEKNSPHMCAVLISESKRSNVIDSSLLSSVVKIGLGHAVKLGRNEVQDVLSEQSGKIAS